MVAQAPAAAAPSSPPPEAAPAPKKTPKEAAKLIYPMASTVFTEYQQAQYTQMLSLATSLGFVCQERRGLELHLAQQIFSRMTQRAGKSIFQIIDFSLSFPRHAAMEIFPAHLQTKESERIIRWGSDSMACAVALMCGLLERIWMNPKSGSHS